MERGTVDPDSSAFRACLSLSWKNPYILLLAFSAGIGGLLFGYDTGVISGAVLYIREDFEDVDRKTWLQELVVSMSLVGAIVGASFGGWMSDRFGRKLTIMFADALFFAGAAIMAVSPNSVVLLVGRLFVGLGVGMASMTAPLYISEVSPTKVRGSLVGLNAFFITGGQFLAYCINLAFTKVIGTWRWMLGVAAAPAFLQFVLMIFLPESPRWLYRKGYKERAEEILRRIYLPDEVEVEMQALSESVTIEMREAETMAKISIITMLKNTTVRRGLYAGSGSLIFQQLVGINTVMYYSPTIVQLAGFASNQLALLLSLITSAINAIGSILSIVFIDKSGRKKLMLISLVGVVASLVLLTVIFHEAENESPMISNMETLHFNQTCPSYSDAANPGAWHCTTCLKYKCGFCASKSKLLPGACLTSGRTNKKECRDEHREWYTKGCPSKIGWVAILGLASYIMFFAPGMGSVPWVLNSEIYPLRYRGICGGIASTSTWVANLIVSQSFLSLTEAIGTAWTFLVFAVLGFFAIIFVIIFVPETKGLPMEEIEDMLENRPLHIKFWKKSNN
ncbi:hypothetical protein L6164_037518 [Bauhinia variegata]|uniref:Uncharacterized protein n=1 Tax=Bauhinia variegata TaxID=167791 RepID=A0ACB9KK99_BAUVA|nr:hypothetical protein L6164_037518 [Bauhinia variegata]